LVRKRGGEGREGHPPYVRKREVGSRPVRRGEKMKGGLPVVVEKQSGSDAT